MEPKEPQSRKVDMQGSGSSRKKVCKEYDRHISNTSRTEDNYSSKHLLKQVNSRQTLSKVGTKYSVVHSDTGDLSKSLKRVLTPALHDSEDDSLDTHAPQDNRLKSKMISKQ